MRVETPIGALLVSKTYDPNRPGIWIDLRREDADFDLPLVLIEIDEDNLVTRVWSDACQEEYTHKITHQNIEDFFKLDL